MVRADGLLLLLLPLFVGCAVFCAVGCGAVVLWCSAGGGAAAAGLSKERYAYCALRVSYHNVTAAPSLVIVHEGTYTNLQTEYTTSYLLLIYFNFLSSFSSLSFFLFLLLFSLFFPFVVHYHIDWSFLYIIHSQ